MDYNEFSEKIKAKYPQYKDMDNKELAQKMVAKYPQYGDITFDDVEQPKQPKGIDLTPSGIGRTMATATVAPFYAAKTGQKVSDAYGELKGKLAQKPKSGLEKTLDVAATFALPQAKVLQAGKLAPLVNNLVTGAYQGGLIGGVQGLQEGKGLEGTAGGAGIGGALGAGLPVIGAKVSQPIKKALENPDVQRRIAQGLEVLTSVPQKFSELALQAEVAGNSILKGKFDPETAYRGVEKKLSQAKKALPTKESYKEQYKQLGEEVGRRLNNSTKPESWYEEQYKNIGENINQNLQSKIKPESYFDTEYNKLGESAYNAINQLKDNAGAKLNQFLDDMRQIPANIEPLRQAIKTVIEKEAKGGTINPALVRSSKEVDLVNDLLSKENLNPVDIHNVKEVLYDIANYDTAGGIKNNTAKRMADQLNNYLRGISPDYAGANDAYANIMNLEKQAGGINPSTIATKLSDYRSGGQLRSGADRAFSSLNDLLPQENRFLQGVENLQNERTAQEFLQNNIKQGTLNNISRFDKLPINEQQILENLAPNEIQRFKDLSLQQGIEANLREGLPQYIQNDISRYSNAPLQVQNALDEFAPDLVNNYKQILAKQSQQDEILKPIMSSAYERNPRLLGNRTDEGAEKALEYLQNNSKINFMNELNNTRAREALEALLPGQGGGSGSAQGFGNLLRTSLMGGLPTLSVLTHNPLAMAGLATVSPRIMAKGTIQNLGNLYRGLNNPFLNEIPRLMTVGGVNMLPLKAGIQYND